MAVARNLRSIRPRPQMAVKQLIRCISLLEDEDVSSSTRLQHFWHYFIGQRTGLVRRDQARLIRVAEMGFLRHVVGYIVYRSSRYIDKRSELQIMVCIKRNYSISDKLAGTSELNGRLRITASNRSTIRREDEECGMSEKANNSSFGVLETHLILVVENNDDDDHGRSDIQISRRLYFIWRLLSLAETSCAQWKRPLVTGIAWKLCT